MILFLIKLVVGWLLISTVVCELSDKFKDGFIHYTIRYSLFVACVVVMFKLQLLAAIPLLAQVTLLAFCTITCLLVYKHILLNQLDIANYLERIDKREYQNHKEMQLH